MEVLLVIRIYFVWTSIYQQPYKNQIGISFNFLCVSCTTQEVLKGREKSVGNTKYIKQPQTIVIWPSPQKRLAIWKENNIPIYIRNAYSPNMHTCYCKKKEKLK